MTNCAAHDVIIVGGGQAGICLSHFLQKRRIPHIVLERDCAFSAWYKRWDGFRTNTPNWMNTLPGIDPKMYPGGHPAGFASKKELTDYFETYLRQVSPPIKTGIEARKINRADNGDWRALTTDGEFRAKNIVVCTGAMSVPRIPPENTLIPRRFHQLHAIDYRRPSTIKSTSVLVVGSGSSGTQICRDLAEANTFDELYLAKSKVVELPGRILGIPIHRFLHTFGLFDIRTRSWIGKLMFSGLQRKADPIVRPTPRDLERRYGVDVVGRFVGVDGENLCFDDGRMIETRELTVLWCTGFGYDYSWIDFEGRAQAFDENDYPIHTRGVVSEAPGLYFLGLRYQHTAASHDIYGVGRDAAFLAEHIDSDNRGRPAGANPQPAL